MTQYMLTVHGTVDDPESTRRDPADLRRRGPRQPEDEEAGIWVFAGGLEPIDLATTVDNTGAEPIVTDGPFAESKEWIGGFWIFELPDLDAALQWATEASKACAGKVEVRPFQREGPDRRMDSPDPTAAIERIYREEYGRIVASLIRRFGDIDIAEEAAGEALLAAVERWPGTAYRPTPAAG